MLASRRVITANSPSEIATRETRIEPCGSRIGMPTWIDQATITSTKSSTSTQTRINQRCSGSTSATVPGRVLAPGSSALRHVGSLATRVRRARDEEDLR